MAVHVATDIEASGGVVSGDVDFKASPGLLLQADSLHENMALGLRDAALAYEVATRGAGFSFFMNPRSRQEVHAAG